LRCGLALTALHCTAPASMSPAPPIASTSNVAVEHQVVRLHRSGAISSSSLLSS
jgi:hypothetical protein